MSVFGTEYASAYDSIYSEKDYQAECDVLEGAFKQFADKRPKTVIDFGCGTGNHAFPLAEREYQVAGIDLSPQMVQLAEEKRVNSPLCDRIEFHVGNAQTFRLNREFDAAIMMFAVLGYQGTNRGVLSALRNVRAHLVEEGLFLFDCWFGPVVLTERPSDRLKVIEVDGKKIIRAASGSIDIVNHTTRVDYRLWTLQDDQVISESSESHVMRFFFPLELELILDRTGFDLLRLGCFPEFERSPDETTWNVFGIAKAK